MATFSNSFWSTDYAGGLGVLFGKLQQGVQENAQVLLIARMRADAEEAYGQRMADIGPATDRISNGFIRDEGASVRKAYDGLRTEMEEAAKNHRKIAANIRELVVNPFNRWCDDHAARVQNSQDDLQARVKLLDRQADVVRKNRSQYYNKCRQVEDLEEEDKLAFKDPKSEAAQNSSPSGKPKTAIPTIREPDPDDDPEPIDIGDQMYMPDQVKLMLQTMLGNIKLGETKVPILGTYQNVSTGADITHFIQTHMNASNISAAEKIGQDLVDHGFLRLIGAVGSNFVNSTKMNYQWRPKVFQITGISERQPRAPGRMASMGLDSAPDSPVVGAVQEYLAGWNPLNNPHPNETPAEKLRREARESDERYKSAVRKLDALRCNLEEAMIDHLKFMERCELDRLKAVKSVLLDFSGAIGNVIPSLQSTVDKLMLFQETVQPVGDLRYMLESYKTGSFVPKVTVYENYYNNVDGQTFGVDLEARARADKKRVPLFVTSILTYLDDHYPDLDGDEARRAIWLVDVPLAATHHLRQQINNGQPIPHELLSKYEIPIVASVLKLYLLELPDALVSSHVYEIVKQIYTSVGGASGGVDAESAESARVNVIQSTLGQLRLANIASLDAICTHFTRLIELTSADDAYVTSLATALAPCILRPKQETTLTMTEKYAYRLLRDLLAHKDAIFGELKRASSLTNRQASASISGGQAGDRGRGRPDGATGGRDRVGSLSDESNRQRAEQERQAAISDRAARAASPNPSRSIRRERSPHRISGSIGGGGAAGRFPIAASPMGSPTSASTSDGGRGRGHSSTLSRHSLEVPGLVSLTAAPAVPAHQESSSSFATSGAAAAAAASSSSANGTTSTSAATPSDIAAAMAGAFGTDTFSPTGTSSPPAPPPHGTVKIAQADGLEKRDSLTRSRGVAPKRSGAGSLSSRAVGGGDHVGVQLSDRPMDD